MTFVVVRVRCPVCGHRSTTVSLAGREHELVCFYCKNTVEVLDTMMTVGNRCGINSVVECHPSKVDVASSNLASRSIFQAGITQPGRVAAS